MGRGIGSYIRIADADFIKSLGRCMYCGSTDHLSIDHIKPLKRGGNSVIENLTLACNKCNGLKTDFELEVFYERMKAKREVVYNKIHNCFHRLRTHRKRNTQPELMEWLIKTINENKRLHSYFTRIIHSIETGKFYPHG